MSRFDRYILSQLFEFFSFFSLVLVAVYWINRALGLFDELIGEGQTVLVFLEYTALTLPNLIRLVLPVSAFAAAVYVTNRLTRESELVVMQATGFSPWRLARPVVYFGLIVAVLIGILMNFVVPASRATLAARTAEIEANATARFMREGTFLHPTPGITFYIREIAPSQEMHDVFLSDARNPDQRVTYSALRAILVKSPAGPKLVMFDGMAQTLDRISGRLTVTRFADFTYDLKGFVTRKPVAERGAEELSTQSLFTAGGETGGDPTLSRAALLHEAHSRIATPLLGLAGPLIGFSALLLGAFSRFGLWRQVLGAVVLLVLVQLADNMAAAAALRSDTGWPFTYLAPALALTFGGAMLWWAAGSGQMSGRAPALVATGA